VNLTSLHARSVKASGKAYVDGTLVAEAEILSMIVDREEEGENR